MWDLPRPGLEPRSLALAGGFLTTVPPGKSQDAGVWLSSQSYLPPLFKTVTELQDVREIRDTWIHLAGQFSKAQINARRMLASQLDSRLLALPIYVSIASLDFSLLRKWVHTRQSSGYQWTSVFGNGIPLPLGETPFPQSLSLGVGGTHPPATGWSVSIMSQWMVRTVSLT